jgi:hypothetical protein
MAHARLSSTAQFRFLTDDNVAPVQRHSSLMRLN